MKCVKIPGDGSPGILTDINKEKGPAGALYLLFAIKNSLGCKMFSKSFLPLVMNLWSRFITAHFSQTAF
jgi:hypothetical protein